MLKEDGWAHVATKGGHWQFTHPTKRGRVTCPTRTRESRVAR